MSGIRRTVEDGGSMAYTALRKMQQANEAEFGPGAGPVQPGLWNGGRGNDLKTAALRFLHERCEGLRFDPRKEEEERKTGRYLGTSYSPNQIPYNMQMDIDRLCLERSAEQFNDSGTTDDAYNVYYCYLEMFFGRYGKSRKMVELLSEYETNGSSLLMKHRDHYAHSVYVFVLGLAVYETNEPYREAFRKYYRQIPGLQDSEQQAAAFFLEYWGLTALFHDIGYPFELPFEQVMSYFEVNQQKRGQDQLVLAYRNTEALTRLGPQARARFEQLYGKTFHNTEELLAWDLTEKLGETYHFSEGYLRQALADKPARPEKYSYYMDHAYFSAMRLYRELADIMGMDGDPEVPGAGEAMTAAHVDALSAILLHNSLYKFSIAHYKDGIYPSLAMSLHPLAWLLMLCDELQCWDRTAYGRNSRTELQPMAAEFDFSGNRISVTYLYDEEERDKIDEFEAALEAWKQNGKRGEEPRLKAYSDMAGERKRFSGDIEKIVDTADCPLKAECGIAPARRGKKHLYLSSSNFLHMCDFAVALNARYAHEGKEGQVNAAQLEEEFEALSLEYKISNINQVKSFGRYLDAIHCFYTDRQVDYEMLKGFTPELIAVFAPMEHARWIREHQAMGWIPGNAYLQAKPPRGQHPESYRKMLREHLRCHELVMEESATGEEMYAHYFSLPESERGKDWLPLNSMLKLIRKFDGLRIYQFDSDRDD